MENGYVVNAHFFVGGFKENFFLDLTDEDKQHLDNILKIVSKQYKNSMFAPLSGVWLFGVFAANYNLWIPAYSFQAPFKTLESAEKASNKLLEKLSLFSKSPICIAISHGDIKVNYKNLQRCYGSAYHKSGRYIDDPNKCINMIKDKISIKIIN